MSHQRLSGFPETGADFWKVQGTSGEVQELLGNLWIAPSDSPNCLQTGEQEEEGRRRRIIRLMGRGEEEEEEDDDDDDDNEKYKAKG